MVLRIDNGPDVARRLKLREIETLITVVNHGSMAAAAAELGITQPAVSEMMSNLERVLGVRLLDRSARGVSPTVFGDVLHRGGVAAIDELRQTIKEMQSLADPTAGEVRVGCPESVAPFLPDIVARLASTHPRVLVHVADVVAPTLDLPQLRDRTLDVALVRFAGPANQHRHVEDLSVEVLLNDELVVVAGRKSRWARYRNADISGLAGADWILPPPSTSNSRTVFEAFRESGLGPPRVTMATFSVHLRTSMVANGSCVSVLPRSVLQLQHYRALVKILPVKLPRHDFPLAIASLKRRMLNPVVQLFIEHTRASLRQMRLR